MKWESAMEGVQQFVSMVSNMPNNYTRVTQLQPKRSITKNKPGLIQKEGVNPQLWQVEHWCDSEHLTGGCHGASGSMANDMNSNGNL